MKGKRKISILRGSKYGTLAFKFVFFGVLILISGIVSGALFSSLPSIPTNSETTNGAWSTRFTGHIFKSCPADQFLKGFNSSFDLICVPYSNLSTSSPAPATPLNSSITFPSGEPSGELSSGSFGSYFNNLFGICNGGTIVKGIASDGTKICVDMNTPDTFTPPVIAPLNSSITYPSTPAGETPNGSFQTYFTAMSQTCGNTKLVGGFDNNGNPICIGAKRQATCNGGIPANASATTSSTFVQTFNGTSWTPAATSWSYGAGTCGFGCFSPYEWRDGVCEVLPPVCGDLYNETCAVGYRMGGVNCVGGHGSAPVYSCINGSIQIYCIAASKSACDGGGQ